MTDELVKRLRAYNDESFVETLCGEAADRIEAMNANYEILWETNLRIGIERDRLREALQLYADPCDATETSPCGYEGNMCCSTAREALKGETS